jgi:hypothetical protein
MMSQIDSWHRKISTGRHFQNGHRNSVQIQHCSISTYWIDSRHWNFFTGLYRNFLKRRIAPLMVTYHYVKFYVSIIIHLEVININVRNFNFPIGFDSNPHPLWTPQNMTLTPFTTTLKTLGPTRTYIYNSTKFHEILYISSWDLPWTSSWSTERKKERKRKRRRIIIITRYDYNLTIMKSLKPATDTIYPHIKFWWYWTMLNFYPPFLCRVLAAILKMAENAELLL